MIEELPNYIRALPAKTPLQRFGDTKGLIQVHRLHLVRDFVFLLGKQKHRARLGFGADDEAIELLGEEDHCTRLIADSGAAHGQAQGRWCCHVDDLGDLATRGLVCTALKQRFGKLLVFRQDEMKYEGMSLEMQKTTLEIAIHNTLWRLLSYARTSSGLFSTAIC